MTIREFLNIIYDSDDPGLIGLLYEKGLAEPQDRSDPDRDLQRSDAARLVHLYLQKEAGIRDLADISKASVLRDLYDCRVCVNHIAQVYLRGIMDGVGIEGMPGDFLIFDHKRHVDRAETVRIRDILKNVE